MTCMPFTEHIECINSEAYKIFPIQTDCWISVTYLTGEVLFEFLLGEPETESLLKQDGSRFLVRVTKISENRINSMVGLQTF